MKKIIEAINAYYFKKLYLLDTNKLTVIDRLRRQESIFAILSLLEFEFNQPVVAQTAFDTAELSKKINENFKSFLSIIDENKADVVALIYTDMKMYDIVMKLKSNDADSSSVSSISPAENLFLEHLYEPLESVFNSENFKKIDLQCLEVLQDSDKENQCT